MSGTSLARQYVLTDSAVDAVILWRHLDDDDEGWSELGCLYAYLEARTQEILYIGKSWGVTVRRRWNRGAKEKFWDDLERERNIKTHSAMHGQVMLPDRKRLTRELLFDMESLLIHKVQPWGNIQGRASRMIYRPGLIVQCAGDWPNRQRIFEDA